MTFVRRATHAGSEEAGWYNGNPAALSRLFESFSRGYDVLPALCDRWQRVTSGGAGHGAAASSSSSTRRLVGVIGPHAGIRFCGATSHVAHRQLEKYLMSGSPTSKQVRRIFLLGPSHRKYIDGVELSQASAYETPFGSFAVDTQVLQDIHAACKSSGVKCGWMSQTTDEEEHSLEMHLPFVGKTMSSCPLAATISIAPILVGENGESAEQALAKIFGPYFGSAENIFVLSTDFCHWGSRFRYTYHYNPRMYPAIEDAVVAMDAEGMRRIEERDMRGWKQYLSETKNTICGRNPLSVSMGAMQWVEQQENRSKNRFDISFVHYSKSGKLADEDDSSVSYASAVIFD